jgi:hypothetical protein
MNGPYVSTPPIRLHCIYSDFTLQTTRKNMASLLPPAAVGFLDSVQVSVADSTTWLSPPTDTDRMAGRLEGNVEKCGGGGIQKARGGLGISTLDAFLSSRYSHWG